MRKEKQLFFRRENFGFLGKNMSKQSLQQQLEALKRAHDGNLEKMGNMVKTVMERLDGLRHVAADPAIRSETKAVFCDAIIAAIQLEIHRWRM